MNQTTKILPFLLFAAACSGDEDGSVGLSVRAVTSNNMAPTAELSMTDDGSSEFRIEEATLRLRHIELDLPDGSDCDDYGSLIEGATCEDGPNADKITIDGPFEIDLVTGSSRSSLDEIKIPAGTYKRIDFRVEDDENNSSFAVVAGFDHEGESTTLNLDLDFNEDIRIEMPQGIYVDEESDLIAEFVVDNWLGEVDITNCMDEGDVTITGNTVFVDDSSTRGACSDIENTIKRNMKESGQFDKRSR